MRFPGTGASISYSLGLCNVGRIPAEFYVVEEGENANSVKEMPAAAGSLARQSGACSGFVATIARFFPKDPAPKKSMTRLNGNTRAS